MKKAYILYFLLFIFPFHGEVGNCVFAQNFIWARNGGGSEDINTAPIMSESVKDIATDINGNVYVVTSVDSTGLRIAGKPFIGYGSMDIMLASFKPDGTLRWVKLIGSNIDDAGLWLRTDEKDGVYIMGTVAKITGPAYIDTDALSPQNYQLSILVKYDTSGKFQWYKHPDADTLTSWNNSASVLAMDVDKGGNTYAFAHLPPGSYGDGTLNVTTKGLYILRYSSSGSFSYIKPDVGGSSFYGGVTLTVDEKNDRFYLSGSGGSLIIGGKVLGYAAYIGCFKMDGSLLWYTEDTTGLSSIVRRPALDGNGNIYFVGFASGSSTFSGLPIAPNIQPQGEASFILKMDKNGNILWVKATKDNGDLHAVAVAYMNNNQVLLTGVFNGLLEWQGSGIPGYNTLVDYGHDMFITRFDANTGDVLGIDKTGSSYGYGESPNCIAADASGHVYIGGGLEKDIYINQSDIINSNGGRLDWFVVKYGDMWPAVVDEINNRYEVNIYPNPATEQIIIEGVKAGSSVSMFNMLGQQVRHTTAFGKIILEISGYIPGNYLLKLTDTDGSIFNRKVIIQ